MASLTGQTVATSYEQLLTLPDGGGNTTTLVPVTDGDGVTTFSLQLATTKTMINGSGNKLYFGDEGSEYISSDTTDLTIGSGRNINLTCASGDVVIPANIGLTFGTGEKIEGDSTDLTVTSGGAINLTATTDVVIPADVGITFGTGEKIEGNSTDLTVTSGADINLTATGDVNIPPGVGVTFGDDGEKIEGDGTDLSIVSSGNLNLTSTVAEVAAIYLRENAGAAGTIKIHADQGTGASATTESDASIQLLSDAGGIGLYSLLNAVDAIRIEANGGTSENIIIHSNQGTSATEGAASIQLLSARGGINIKSGLNNANAILLTADAGTSETIKIHSDQGTGADSISLVSDVGGITLDAGLDIVLDADGSQISMKWGGEAGQIDFTNANSGDGVIQQKVNDKDLVIQQFDGTEVCRFEDGGTVRVGPAAGSDDWFRLPAVDGSANQVLSTDGSGAVTWASQTDTAATATDATNFFCTANNSTDETVYPVFVDGATDNQGGETDTGLTYNPSTGLMTATAFSGSLTGTLQTAAQTNITSVGTLGSLTVSGALTAGSLALDTVSNASGNVTLDASADVILDADGDDFIFKIGSASPSATSSTVGYENELMRITWGKEDTTQGWNTGFDDKSVIRFQHVAKLAPEDGEPSSPVFQFAGLDINSFDTPSAGLLGEISKHGFIGYGKPGRGGFAINNQCLGNGNINAAASKNVLINMDTSVDLTTDGNVMIGYQAGYAATGPLYGVLIGLYAGYELTTGNVNIIIGNSSGATLKTGKDNVIIGAYTKTSSSDSSNQIIIGTGASANSRLAGIDNSVVIGKSGATNFIYANYTSSGTWSHDSDVRMKENIVDNNIGLDFINMLRPVNYTMKSPSEFPKEWDEYDAKDKKKDYKVRYGFIAQEVKEAIDKFGADYFDGWSVTGNGKQGVGFASFVVPLIKAVQELSARVEHLETNNKTVTHIN